MLDLVVRITVAQDDTPLPQQRVHYGDLQGG